MEFLSLDHGTMDLYVTQRSGASLNMVYPKAVLKEKTILPFLNKNPYLG